MAFKLPSRVKETTVTTGTGAYTLGGALSTAWRTFAAGGLANLDTTFYYAESATEYELGIGTWNTGGTLTRTAILASSNGGAVVSWAAGAKVIGIGMPGPEDLDGGAYQAISYLHGAMGIKSNKNLLHNGGFQVAQRGSGPFTSVTVPVNSDDSYLLDGCIFLANGADVCDVSRVIGDPDFVSGRKLRLDVETANLRFGVLFPIENAVMQGVRKSGRASVQFKVKRTGTSLANVRAYLLAWNSTADVITSDVISAWGGAGGDPTFVANWTAENVASQLAVGTATVLYRIENIAVDTANVANLALLIISDPVTTTIGDFLDLGDVQVEEGALATDYEHRSVSTDVDLCKRYYHQLGGASSYPRIYGYTVAGQYLITPIPFPTSMRITPTAGKSGSWAVTNCGQPAVSGVDAEGWNMQVQVTATAVASVNPDGADDYFAFSAEL